MLITCNRKKKTTAVACPCIVMLREALKSFRHPQRVPKKIVGLAERNLKYVTMIIKVPWRSVAFYLTRLFTWASIFLYCNRSLNKLDARTKMETWQLISPPSPLKACALWPQYWRWNSLSVWLPNIHQLETTFLIKQIIESLVTSTYQFQL